MKKEGYWVIRTYVSGIIGEKVKYWVPGEKPTKSIRKMKSDIRKQKQNENDAVKRLARLIHANMKAGDCFHALTYNDESLAKLMALLPQELNEEERMNALYFLAHHQLQLYLRRCREACKKAGVEFKYIAITSDMDGKTGEVARIHHHIVAPKEVEEILVEKWTMGEVRKRYVWNEADHTGLADYMIRQVRHLPDAKKYIPSRNLVVPAPSKPRLAKGGKEVQPPRGAELLYRAPFKKGMPQYIRYIVPRRNSSSAGKDTDSFVTGGVA